jgi:hypothetical protein
MSGVSSRNQLIVGLPETGKTTFLAALWHVVTSEEIPGTLRLAHLYGSVEYLNEISGKWISSLPLGRTIQGAEELNIKMRLKTSEGEEATELVFPDMSGEAYRHLWDDRQWESHYDGIARAATGALLFIHPDKVEHPARIAELAIPAENGKPIEDGSNHRAADWHANHAGTAVKLVELLQFFTEESGSYRIERLSIVISAWDLVRENLTPEEWLAKRLPLLGQYLRANQEKLAYRIYGLSAQGGDIAIEADRLRGLLKQSERIEIIGEDCRDHDITAPVKWAAGL